MPSLQLAQRAQAAGSPLGLSVRDILAAKVGLSVILLLFALGTFSIMPGKLGLLELFGLPILAFFTPDLLLSKRARVRGRAMEIEFPDLLDLLRVSTEAGLGLGRALSEVSRHHRGLMSGEWSVAAKELTLGVPRSEVLERLAQRCPVVGMAQLVATIERAEKYGVPLAEPLAAQAREIRAQRSRRIREQADKAAPKVQLVVALLLVPSVMLLVAAALLLTFGEPG